MPRIKCTICNKEYYERPSHIKEKNFCSVSCYSVYRGRMIPKTRKVCLNCGAEFYVANSRLQFSNPTYCSRECLVKYKHEHALGNRRFYKGDKCKLCGKEITYKNKSGLCRSCGMKGHTHNNGRKHTPDFCKKISQRMMEDKNPQWKGKDVGYGALHEWVKRRKVKPELCEQCGERPSYDLANKGIYNREFENWWYLCRKCHMKLDGRLRNLKQYR